MLSTQLYQVKHCSLTLKFQYKVNCNIITIYEVHTFNKSQVSSQAAKHYRWHFYQHWPVSVCTLHWNSKTDILFVDLISFTLQELQIILTQLFSIYIDWYSLTAAPTQLARTLIKCSVTHFSHEQGCTPSDWSLCVIYVWQPYGKGHIMWQHIFYINRKCGD